MAAGRLQKALLLDRLDAFGGHLHPQRAHERNEDMLVHTGNRARSAAERAAADIRGLEAAAPRMIDTSGDRFRITLGTRDYDKRGLVARLAATFAFSAIFNNDRVGLIGFTDRVEVFVPPRSGRKHVLAVISRVLTHEPEHRGTRPAASLEYLSRLAVRHSVAILISDFVDVLPSRRRRGRAA